MSNKIQQIEDVREDFRSGSVDSVEVLREQLSPISIGGVGKIAVASRGSRMFRVRNLDDRPANVGQISEPPPGVAPIGRINEAGQSVLYLSDSPRTAFAESLIHEGECCLSEWRVECDRLGLVNGGMPTELMDQYFPNDLNVGDPPSPTEEDALVLAFFRELFTVDVGNDTERYVWSIACASANGFSHVNDRESSETVGQLTKIIGRTPFSAIVYPSIRTDRTSVNYALNDVGRANISLHHVQWVRRHSDGRMQGIDFANSFGENGEIEWQGRPANFVLKSGEAGKLRRMSLTEYIFETEDGSIPWFG